MHRPSQPLCHMCTQITKRALYKRARRDVSALAFDKSRLYIPQPDFLSVNRISDPQPDCLSATGTIGTAGPNHRNNRNNRTGSGRADFIKFFIMPCPASSVTIHKTTTAQNKGSKQRLKAKAHKQTNNGRRKYHKKDHSPRIQTRIVQSLGDRNKGDVEIQQALQHCRRHARRSHSSRPRRHISPSNSRRIKTPSRKMEK